MANILVVDDSAVARLIIAHILRGQSHLVLEAEDGRFAQTLLQARSDIDLLITDIYMADMDGVELAHWLRQRLPANRQVPVVMMTASGEEKGSLGEKTVLADGVLTKPVSTWELLAMTGQLLGEAA